MSTALTIGRIDDEAVSASAFSLAAAMTSLPKSWLGRVKTDQINWLNCQSAIATVNCLNIASVAAFLTHAAELEGIRIEERITRTTWPNLPDYEQTYWLPIEFSKPQVVTKYGWPFALGSATALLRELAEIRAMSPLSLGVEPDGFEHPREVTLSHQATLQWVWFALNKAATQAVRLGAPLSIG